MTVKYELRVHARDVRFGQPGDDMDIGNHTGYDLIMHHDDGSMTIQYIDLYNDGGNINFYISDEIRAYEYSILENLAPLKERFVIWGETTFQNNELINTTEGYLKDHKAYAEILLNGEAALNAFNKIKLETSILKQLSSKLDYKTQDRNCNTCTNYFAQEYLGGMDVFSKVPYGVYQGWFDPFYDSSSSNETDITIKKVDEFLDQFYSLIDSDFDITSAEAEAVIQADGWHLKITDGNKNYIFDGDGASSISDSGNSADSFVYLGDGHNVLHTGSGKDEIYGGKDVDSIATGGGDSLVYTYDGNDVVNTNLSTTEDVNKIYLGGGNDNFIGGSGCDIVSGGSGNNDIWLGRDKISDVYFSNVINGEVDVVWNSTKEDYIVLAGGVREQETKDNDLYV